MPRSLSLDLAGRILVLAGCALAVMTFATSRALAKAPVLSSGDVTLDFQINPAHNGVQNDDSLRPPLVKKWSVYLPRPQSDPQVSFPIIVGGRVFVTAWCYCGDNYAYALDLATGRIDWGPIDIGPGGHWSSLTYDSGRLFVTNTNGDLMALDPATGGRLWTDPGVAVDDSPTAVNGVIYTGPDLQAYSESTGALLWRQNDGGLTGMPSVAGNVIYTAGEQDNLNAYTTAGQPLWSYSGPAQGDTPEVPVVSSGQLFLRSPTIAYQNVYPGWIHQASTGAQTGSFHSFSVPAADASYLYGTVNTATGDQSDDTYEIEAYHRSNGSEAWTFDGDNQLDSSPLISGGYVYEGSWGQDVYALNASTGREAWSAALGGAVPPSNDEQKTAPLSGLGIGGGYLIVPTTLNGTTTGPTLTAFASAGPAGTLNADSVAFGTQAVGGQTASATLMLTDTGSQALAAGQAALGGGDPGDFRVLSDGCTGRTISPGASCSVAVAFAPGATGGRQATLTFASGDGKHAVALTGTGT